MARHVRPTSTVGHRRAAIRTVKAVTAAAAVTGLFGTVLDSSPRYDRAIGVLVYACLLALLGVPPRQRVTVSGTASGVAAVLLALAGVVAGISLDEAFSLVSGGVLLLVLAGLARLPARVNGSARASS